ncbi:MAG: hypothetical protein FJ272_11350 [Planctomycetes bacterium]|nr:hypothetical protein [Planctomycetota bacterium]
MASGRRVWRWAAAVAIVSAAGCGILGPSEQERQLQSNLISCQSNCARARKKIEQVEARLKSLEEPPPAESKPPDPKPE